MISPNELKAGNELGHLISQEGWSDRTVVQILIDFLVREQLVQKFLNYAKERASE